MLSRLVRVAWRPTTVFSARALLPMCRSRWFAGKASAAPTAPAHSSGAAPPPGRGPKPDLSLRGLLTLDQLRAAVKSDEIDTVVLCFTDCYGRNMGKRFDADFFLDDAVKGGTHACDYLFACNMNMDPIPGFKFANWEQGYGDVHLVPDMATLRVAAWAPKTALVVCDAYDNKTHELVPVAPRSMLHKQIKAAEATGHHVLAASELEYFLFHTSFREAAEKLYTPALLRSVSTTVEDYHLLQTAREEPFNQKARRALARSGVPVETTKGEVWFWLGIGRAVQRVVLSVDA